MKEIITSFFSEISHKVALMILVGTTALTTGTAIVKLSNKPSQSETTVNNDINSPADDSLVIAPTTAPSPTTTVSPVPSTHLSPTPKAVVTVKSPTISFTGDDSLDDEKTEREDSENEVRYINTEKSVIHDK